MKKITVEIEVTDLMYEFYGDCGEDADCSNCECCIGTDDCIFNHKITDSKEVLQYGQQMINWNTIQKLMNCFPKSYVNSHGEFIAHERSNAYFILRDCETELSTKCKVLEWFSRAAFKTEPYRSIKKNDEFHKFMLNGINQFLQTKFTPEDMCEIYTYLGNACNHNKTIRFIESGYDLAILQEDKQ